MKTPATTPGTPISKHKRAPIPWLVGWSDFRRYLGRALDACDKGHVVLFRVPTHIKPGTERQRLFAVAHKNRWEQTIGEAIKAFEQGRYRRVQLSSLPSKRNSDRASPNKPNRGQKATGQSKPS